MKTILKLMLSGIILFGAVPTVNAMDMKMDNMEEVKKKEKMPYKKLSLLPQILKLVWLL